MAPLHFALRLSSSFLFCAWKPTFLDSFIVTQLRASSLSPIETLTPAEREQQKRAPGIYSERTRRIYLCAKY